MTATTVWADPPAGRRLVVCLDGTWNSTANVHERETGDKVLRPTNTLKICRAVKPIADRPQIAYYDIGVGSLTRYPGTANKILYRADKMLGGAWGAGFEGNVEDALHFIVLNYEPGDEVFLFGFSRGAATARAVTRFLEWSGGLPSKRDAYYVPLFFRHYVEQRGNPEAFERFREEINRKRETNRDSRNRYPIEFRPIVVRYLGVWDTVASLGSRFAARGATTSPAGRTFHIGKAPAPCVKHARQALAIDEKRFDFRPEVWTEQRPEVPEQIVLQRWFPGVHSNIGGGLETDGLANLALHWILEGAKDEKLQVDEDFIAFYEGHPEAKMYESWTLKYKILEGIRLRAGKGKRPITGINADLDESVVKKMQIDASYRPDSVLQFLACRSDLTPYGDIPADARQRIASLKTNCPNQSR
ncbi:MAG TPA: DUF2235 domain-containing protein [Thermoanaerobaculia bacterium]